MVVGAEVHDGDLVSGGTVTKDVPPSRYATFTTENGDVSRVVPKCDRGMRPYCLVEQEFGNVGVGLVGYVEDIRAIVGHRPLILVGSAVIITNKTGKILLQQRRSPYGVWGLPGGLMELGESVEDTGRREVYEETGLCVGNLDLIGVFSGPNYFVKADNGDEFYVVTAAFHTSDFSGNLSMDIEEGLELTFFNKCALPRAIFFLNHRAA